MKWETIIGLLQLKNTICVTFKKFFKQRWISETRMPHLESLSNLKNTKDSIVYVVFSTQTKLFYIGETGNLLSRIKTEFRNARLRSPIMTIRKDVPTQRSVWPNKV